MQQTLVSSHRPAKAVGFTLLELLIVITIISLLAGASAPALWRSIETAREQRVLEQLQLTLIAQPRLAVTNGSSNRVTAANLAALIPSSYQVTLSEPLYYAHNGMSKGGIVRLVNSHGDLVAEYKIISPSGQVKLRASALGS